MELFYYLSDRAQQAFKGAQEWNGLPDNLKEVSSVDTFKKKTESMQVCYLKIVGLFVLYFILLSILSQPHSQV